MELATSLLPERDHEHERIVGIVFNIPPQQAAIVSCLARGAVATTDQLWAYLESKTPPKLVMFHARSRLQEEGMDIKSKRSVGYWMEEDTRKKIEKRVTDFVEGR